VGFFAIRNSDAIWRVQTQLADPTITDDGQVEIKLKSGAVYLSQGQYQQLAGEILDATPRQIQLQYQKFTPNKIYEDNRQQLRLYMDSGKLAMGGSQNGAHVTRDQNFLSEVAFAASESGWTKDTFQQTVQECSAQSLVCYFGTNAGLTRMFSHQIVQGGDTYKTSGSAYLCVDCYGTMNSGRTRFMVRHEKGHILARAIAKKHGAFDFYAMLKKWTQAQHPKSADIFPELASDFRNQLILLSYEPEEGLDVAFVFSTAGKTLKAQLADRSSANLKREFLDKSDEDIRTSFSRGGQTNAALLRVARNVIELEKYGHKKVAGQARTKVARVFPEKQKEFKRYLTLFTLVYDFYKSEEAWLKKQAPEFFKKI